MEPSTSPQDRPLQSFPVQSLQRHRTRARGSPPRAVHRATDRRATPALNFASCAGIEPQVIQTQPPHHHRLGLLYRQRLPLLIKANTTRRSALFRAAVPPPSLYEKSPWRELLVLSEAPWPSPGPWTSPPTSLSRTILGKVAVRQRAPCLLLSCDLPPTAHTRPTGDHQRVIQRKIQILNSQSPKLTLAVLTSFEIRPMSPTTSRPQQNIVLPSA